jgi:MscS family membrane protein
MAAEAVGGAAPAEIFDKVGVVRDVTVVWLLAWFAVRFIRFVEEHIVLGDDGEPRVDLTTARAVGKLLRATVMITAILLVLQAFGFSISGVLAFGGIGGIAVGFAARDLLANFFGAMMIFLDRPFSVGDWVRSPDREIEGTVEEIGWRLTRIRTFDKRPLFIPNSVFTTLAVENPSRMHNRRIYETIGIRYDDIGVMAAIVTDIESMLRTHEAIETDATLMVNFVEFGPSSVDFFVYCFTKTIVWTEFHVIKQDILLNIARIITHHGAEIAFPTQTLHIAPEPGPVEISPA